MLLHTLNLNYSDHAKLREMLSQGVGFHHAGMDAQDRLIVEDVFRRGKLPVLVSTRSGHSIPAEPRVCGFLVKLPIFDFPRGQKMTLFWKAKGFFP